MYNVVERARLSMAQVTFPYSNTTLLECSTQHLTCIEYYHNRIPYLAD